VTVKGSCILCGSSDPELLFKDRDRSGQAKGEFSVVKCRGCGLVYTLPDADIGDIREFYPDERCGIESAGPVAAVSSFESWLSKRYSRLLWRMLAGEDRNFLPQMIDFFENILSFPFYRYRNRCFPYRDKPGRLLDIGCGSGKLLSLEKRLGWEVYGVELEEKKASYAREVRDLNVITGDFKDIEYKSDFFDVISLRHVLEHLINPLVDLKKIREILKPGGLLVIRVPNQSRIEMAVFGKRWRAYDLPRHRFHFDRRTISKLVLKSGLKPLKISQALYINYMISGIGRILEERGAPLWITGFFNIENKVLRGIFLPLGFLLKIIGQSSEILVYAGKG